MIDTVHTQLALNICLLHLTFSSHNPSILLNLVISMLITSIYLILTTKSAALLDFKGIIKDYSQQTCLSYNAIKPCLPPNSQIKIVFTLSTSPSSWSLWSALPLSPL